MTKDYILGGVANAHLFAGDDLFCDAVTTLTDSGMNVQLQAEEVRGGKGAALLGRYFHSSGMTLTLTNATFNMAYLAASVGAEIKGGADVLRDEQIKATTAGQLTLSYAAVPLNGCNGQAYAWYKKAGDDNAQYARGTVAGTILSAGAGAEIEANTDYCVKYFYNEAAADEITINSDFVPKTLHLVLDANLYAVGDTAASGQTKVGTVIIDVPAFQLNGNQDLTLNMTGAATINLEGMALAVKTCDVNCAGGKYYAKIAQVIDGTNWYEGINSIAADGGKAVLKDGSAKLNLYALYADKAPQRLTADMLNGLTLKVGTDTITNFTYTGTAGNKDMTLLQGTDILATGAIAIISEE